jgi:hypothetical protein
MRINLLIAFLLLGSLAVVGQGNLQFNQVLLLNASFPATYVTVPEGKIWKIESTVTNSTGGNTFILLDGGTYYLTNVSAPYLNMPFWLPASTYVGFGVLNGLSGKVSVLEFNIVE